MTTDKAAKITAAIANRLRVEAFNRRVSQGALAETVGVSRSAINEYLNGKSPIPLAAYLDMCDRLGLDSEDVLREAFKAA